MKLIVLADDQRWEALRATAPEAEWIRAKNDVSFMAAQGATAFFNLEDNSGAMNYSNIGVPVFINSVSATLSEINAAGNIIRINSWPGFIEKPVWEIAGKINTEAETVLQKLQKKYIAVNDEPGFISARVIAMIINEAFYAMGDNVSSERDIDTAMKLGTNYPFGPFEWGRSIGMKNIFTLLKKLSSQDERYRPALALENEINSGL